ncbi:MAG: hypothetical protein WC651_05575, partial [Candidatus Gracilibacteria bacterium]
MNIKRIIQNLLLATGLFLLMSAGTTFAVSIYQVTEAGTLGAATVGTAQAYEIEYTVDTAAQTWAEGDTLAIQLPANFPEWASLTYTVEIYEDVTNNGTDETAISAGLTAGTYVVAGRTLQIEWAAVAPESV